MRHREGATQKHSVFLAWAAQRILLLLREIGKLGGETGGGGKMVSSVLDSLGFLS